MLDAAVKATGGPLDHIVYTAAEDMSSAKLVDTTTTKALSSFTVRYLGLLLIGKLVAANPKHYLNPAVPPRSRSPRKSWATGHIRVSSLSAAQVLSRC